MPAGVVEGRARVVATRALAPDVLEADLALEDPPSLVFRAGQWLSIPVAPKTIRAYSIASTPRSPARLTLCADVAPGGVGSRWFRALGPGAEVLFKGPLGGFVFSRADPRRLLFVAEEIGVVPIRSILTELYETGLGRPTTLVYAVRDPAALVYHGEFLSLARRYPAFAYHPIVAGDAAGWTGLCGDPVETVAGLAADARGLVAYVAGGERMIHRVRDALTARGGERRAVKWEKFW